MDSDSSNQVRNGGIIGGKNGALLKSIMGNFKSIIGSSLKRVNPPKPGRDHQGEETRV